MGDQYANHAEYRSVSMKVTLDERKAYLLFFLDETA